MPPSSPLPQPNPAPGQAVLSLPRGLLEADAPSEPSSVPLLTAGSDAASCNSSDAASDPKHETMPQFQPLETFSCSEPFSAPCNANQNPVCNLAAVDVGSAFEVTRVLEGGSNTADTLPGSVQDEADELHDHEADELHEPDDSYESYRDVPTSELRNKVLELQERLRSEGVLVFTPIVWNGETGPKEKLAMRRAGFLFAMYRADVWWFEILEMIRKLIINGIVVYIAHKEIRIVVGFAVCFLSLLVSMQMRPFASPKLNQLMVTGLAFQTTTLTYGIVVSVRGNALKDTSVSR